MRLRIVVATSLSAATCQAQAQAQQGAGDRVLHALRECRQIPAPTLRLACFDKAAGALDEAVRTKAVTILDRQEVRETRRSLFGFTLPKIGLFGGGTDKADEKDDIRELNTTIASARPLGDGRFELRLEGNEAVWATTEALAGSPRQGRKVRIRRGALGNYFITIAGERSVRGMRLR